MEVQKCLQLLFLTGNLKSNCSRLVKLESLYVTDVLEAPICTIDTYSVFIYYVYLRAGSHGVPSPTHVNKSQHGGKALTFEPKETTKVWLVSIGS